MATTELDISPDELHALQDLLLEAGIPKSLLFLTVLAGKPFSLELYDGHDSIEFVACREDESAFVRDRIEED